MEEIEGINDTRTGAKDWEVRIRSGVRKNSCEGGTTNKKGKGKDKSNQNLSGSKFAGD